MTQYILHIGYGKTGTTALQRFLASNREELRERGILYPDAKVNGVWLGSFDHNMVARALVGRLGWWNTSLEAYLSQFEEQCRSTGAHTVILSAESFMGFLQPWDFDSADAYWHALGNNAAHLAKILEGHQITIVVYLRRQDHWMDSAINQTIKYGGLLDDGAARWPTEILVEKYAPRLDYARCLDAWAQAFPSATVKVGVYERGQLNDHGIVEDFFSLIRLPSDGLKREVFNDAERNFRLSRDVLEVKRILNRVERPKYEERVLAACLRDISAEMGNANDDWPLLTTAQREALAQKFASSNADVARRYLGRDDGILFKEPNPSAQPENEAYPGLRIEAALEIIMRADRYMSSFSVRLQMFRHWAAEILRKNVPVLHGFARLLRMVMEKAIKRQSV